VIHKINSRGDKTLREKLLAIYAQKSAPGQRVTDDEVVDAIKSIPPHFANATAIVPSTRTFYDTPGRRWPWNTAGSFTPAIFYPGEMIGLGTDGYATHLDDTAAFKFLGLFEGHFLDTTLPPSTLESMPISQPLTFSMPLASGTASRVTDIGKKVYAVDNAHVQIGTGGLTFGNLVGTIVDIQGTGNPEALTGSEVVIKAAALDYGVAGAIDILPLVVPISATDASRSVYIATSPMRFNAVSYSHTVGSTSGTLQIEKLTGTTAPGSGTVLLTGTIDMSAATAANTVVNGVLIATLASLLLATGDRLGIKIGGTLTSLAGAIASISVTPQ
jgi:hypothetical protein